MFSFFHFLKTFFVRENYTPRKTSLDPELAFRTYDENYYDDVVDGDRTYSVEPSGALDKKLIQEKFLDIIKYYNDVVMTNTMVFSEDELLEYQKKIFKIEEIRKNFTKNDEPSIIHVDGEFFKYIIKKVESIQQTLGTYNKQLSYFYNRHKVTYDTMSILIIVMSSSLSLIEGITLCFSEENVASTIVSLLISTSIAVLTSVLKFKNIKEKLEELVKMKEKIHSCQGKLFTFDKELKTTLFLSGTNSNERVTIGSSSSPV
jgi:hypothetical protein